MNDYFVPTTEQIEAITNVPHFKDGHYVNLDIEKTIDFFHRFYVKPVERTITFTKETSIADIGTGYGWLAIAWAIHTPVKVVAIDVDTERLEAAKKIAEILGVEERIVWKVGALGSTPLEDRSIDVVCCIEVLEHVYGNEKAIEDLGRVSRQLVLLTTPNKWFPIIAHDTRLPFCHWLPITLRKFYAAAFGRTNTENDNIFWSPNDLRQHLATFSRVPGFMQFSDFQSYLNEFPYYLPYGNGRTIQKIGAAKKFYFAFASRFGRYVQILLPNLASIYVHTCSPSASVGADRLDCSRAQF